MRTHLLERADRGFPPMDLTYCGLQFGVNDPTVVKKLEEVTCGNCRRLMGVEPIPSESAPDIETQRDIDLTLAAIHDSTHSGKPIHVPACQYCLESVLRDYSTQAITDALAKRYFFNYGIKSSAEIIAQGRRDIKSSVDRTVPMFRESV